MFVRSRMSGPVIYRKCGKSWTIKPYSVTLIDDPRVSAKELKMYYGSKIEVISDEVIYEDSSGGRQPIKNMVESKEEKPVKKAGLYKANEKSLDDILDQVNKELEELDDNKKADTTKNARSSEVKSVEPANDAKSEDKDSENNLVPPNANGDTKAEAKKEEKKAKPARARRTTSNKAKAKRVSNKKTTKK